MKSPKGRHLPDKILFAIVKNKEMVIRHRFSAWLILRHYLDTEVGGIKSE